jgi:hypothetical protein
MRHLLSLVLGVILAPLIYILVGIADAKLFEGIPDLGSALPGSGSVNVVAEAIAFACALVAGGLYALLVLTRLSPVGTVVAGLILMVPTIWMVVAYSNFVSTMPTSVLGVHGGLHDAGAFMIAIAVPLLFTVFSPRRWRSKAQPAAPAFEATGYGTATTTSPVYEPAGAGYSSGTSAYGTTPAYTPSSSYTPSSYSTYSSDTTISTPSIDSGS